MEDCKPSSSVKNMISRFTVWKTTVPDKSDDTGCIGDSQSLSREIENITCNDLRSALRSGLDLVCPEDRITFVQNCIIGFGNISIQYPKRLKSAIPWLTHPKDNTFFDGYRFEEGFHVEKDLQIYAIITLEIHDAKRRSGWTIERAEWHTCVGNNFQVEIYSSLVTILGKDIEYDASKTDVYTRIAENWICVPNYLQMHINANSYSNAENLLDILQALTEVKPETVEQATELIHTISNVRYICAYIGNDFSPDIIKRLADEHILLTEAEHGMLLSNKDMVIPLLAESLMIKNIHSRTLRDIASNIKIKAEHARRKSNYTKLSKPDEGGASSARENSLWKSVEKLLNKHGNLGELGTVITQVLYLIKTCKHKALDTKNEHGHTPREKADMAVKMLMNYDASKDRYYINNFNDSELKPPINSLGIIALVFAVIENHEEVQEKEFLHQDFIMALSRCLKDEEESATQLPSVNCRRGYAEQLVLALFGFGYNLPCEVVYKFARPKEIFYNLGPEYNEKFNGEIPSNTQAKEFHEDAMRKCKASIDEAYNSADTNKDKQDEVRKAFHDLSDVCKDMNWPEPSKELMLSYNVVPL